MTTKIKEILTEIQPWIKYSFYIFLMIYIGLKIFLIIIKDEGIELLDLQNLAMVVIFFGLFEILLPKQERNNSNNLISDKE